MTSSDDPSPPPVHHRGPPLLPVVLSHVLLFFSGLLAVTAFAGGDRFPSPFLPADAAFRFFAAHPWATRVGGFFHFASAIPLGIFTAGVVSRLRFLGVRPAGELIALYGGFAASIALAVSGLSLWALSEVSGMPASASAVRVLQLLSFAAGGPGTVVPLGLLVAGVSVPAGLTRKLPRWLVWFGLVVALLAELSTLVLVVPGAAVLLPIGRFGGFAWLLGTAITMPATRSRAERTS